MINGIRILLVCRRQYQVIPTLRPGGPAGPGGPGGPTETKVMFYVTNKYKI